MSKDLALNRGSMNTQKDLEYECSIIIREVADINSKISQANKASNKNIRSSALKEREWFIKRASKIGCKDEALASLRSTADKTTSNTSPSKATEINTYPGLSFDECFTKCRELTNRTNEKCFDICLNYGK